MSNYPGIFDSTSLCCNFNGENNSTVFIDSGPEGHTLTRGGNAVISTSEWVWGGASLYLDGSSYVYISEPGWPSSKTLDDWDVFADELDSYTIDAWIKMTNRSDIRTICSHYDNSEDGYYWIFNHINGTGLNVEMANLGWVPSQGLSLSGGEITDDDWHHVALCKRYVATPYYAAQIGLYLDGSQVAYVSASDFGEFTADFCIGAEKRMYIATVTNFFVGYIDDFRLGKANYFNAMPNPGLTDEIAVPHREYSSGQKGNIFMGCNV